MLKAIYRAGFCYKKVGVLCLELVADDKKPAPTRMPHATFFLSWARDVPYLGRSFFSRGLPGQ